MAHKDISTSTMIKVFISKQMAYQSHDTGAETLIVTGGEADDTTYAELVSPSGKNICKLPNMIGRNRDNTQTGRVTCGGGQYTCAKLGNGGWMTKVDLLKWRSYHCTWKRPDGLIQLMGGEGVEQNTTSEVVNVSTGESVPGFDMVQQTM